ncbi:Uric acid degradation bifunctional protein TTL [Arachis hypogaea]|nr:Uric acid degradation bifunctional protein TTL [Arachis hypogaea]
MVEASPFSSLEHATSFARDLWFNTLPIQSWLDTFSAHRHIGDAITVAHGDIRTTLQGLLQFATKYRKKFGFGFITSTNLFLKATNIGGGASKVWIYCDLFSHLLGYNFLIQW